MIKSYVSKEVIKEIIATYNLLLGFIVFWITPKPYKADIYLDNSAFFYFIQSNHKLFKSKRGVYE